jgi:Uncharacterized protein conserved in bacteria (DUF2252)
VGNAQRFPSDVGKSFRDFSISRLFHSYFAVMGDCGDRYAAPKTLNGPCKSLFFFDLRSRSLPSPANVRFGPQPTSCSGWTQIKGRPYFVRQMKNIKASIPIEWLSGDAFNFYVWACGAILARAHARTTDIALIAGYCGKASVLD